MKKMLQGRQALALALLAGMIMLSACSSTKSALSSETAFVAPEKMRLRSSTAEAARNVGEVKSGDKVTISERRSEGSTVWANITGPNGESGWIEARYLVKEEIVKAAQKLAAEMEDQPTQAVGKSKARLKLRLTPDRTDDDNVAFELPAGSVLDIVARERQPRPEKLEQRPATAAPGTAPAGPKFDDWYKVRLKSGSIIPAGWIYGGSVELDVPGDIVFYTSTGQRITGWQTLGSVQDEQNQTKEHYLVAEKQLFGGDEQLDFNRLKVLAFDPKKGEYYTPFREEVRGRFPIVVKKNGKAGTIKLTALGRDQQPQPLEYTFEMLETGRPKVTRVTPREGGKKR